MTDTDKCAICGGSLDGQLTTEIGKSKVHASLDRCSVTMAEVAHGLQSGNLRVLAEAAAQLNQKHEEGKAADDEC